MNKNIENINKRKIFFAFENIQLIIKSVLENSYK